MHDQKKVEETLDEICIPVRRGRPKKRPAKIELDKGYDSKAVRKAIRKRHIWGRVSRRRWRGITHQRQVSDEKWGVRKRYAVERTFAWWDKYRRLLVRWERCPEIHLGFLLLASILEASRKLFLK